MPTDVSMYMLPEMLRVLSLTAVCLVGWQLSQAAGTSSSRLWDPFLQFSGKFNAYKLLHHFNTTSLASNSAHGNTTFAGCLTLIYLINNPKGAVGKILK